MNVASISAVGLRQSVFSIGNSSQLQQTLKSLSNSLTSGDWSGAQSAFQTLQTLFQNSATSDGSSLSSDSQLSTDMSSLGSALTSGDFSTAQTAFAAVQSDLKSSSAPSTTNEMTAASESVQLVEGLLSTLNSSDSSSTSNLDSALQSVYGNNGSVSVLA